MIAMEFVWLLHHGHWKLPRGPHSIHNKAAMESVHHRSPRRAISNICHIVFGWPIRASAGLLDLMRHVLAHVSHLEWSSCIRFLLFHIITFLMHLLKAIIPLKEVLVRVSKAFVYRLVTILTPFIEWLTLERRFLLDCSLSKTSQDAINVPLNPFLQFRWLVTIVLTCTIPLRSLFTFDLIHSSYP